jgi:hypothetical protein
MAYTASPLTLKVIELEALLFRIYDLAEASPTTLSGDISEALGLLADWQPDGGGEDRKVALRWIEWLDIVRSYTTRALK